MESAANEQRPVPGQFITLEGVEGAGKSTQIDAVTSLLNSRGIDVVVSREPGGTPLAEEIRSMLLTPREESISPMTEALAAFAARSQHLDEIIRPALRAGKWVVCDRFTDSTIAYQGGGRGVDKEELMQVATVVHNDCWPDLTVYLDVPVETSMRRVAQRERKPDRFEIEGRPFFERVRNAYKELVETHAFVIEVDANRPVEAVRDDVCYHVDRYVTRRQQEIERIERETSSLER